MYNYMYIVSKAGFDVWNKAWEIWNTEDHKKIMTPEGLMNRWNYSKAGTWVTLTCLTLSCMCYPVKEWWLSRKFNDIYNPCSVWFFMVHCQSYKTCTNNICLQICDVAVAWLLLTYFKKFTWLPKLLIFPNDILYMVLFQKEFFHKSICPTGDFTCLAIKQWDMLNHIIEFYLSEKWWNKHTYTLNHVIKR